MELLTEILNVLQARMETPQPYGWFHLLFFAASIAGGILLCVFCKNDRPAKARAIILTASVISLLLEVYKQIVYTYTVQDGTIVADFQWYAFPWQFCSMPMYTGLIAGLLPKGRVHDSLCAFQATYGLFGGICVMLYPVQVFIPMIGINIQTMVWHGLMVAVGIWMLGSGYVKVEHKTILRALPVFGCTVGIAMILNEIAHFTGLLETDVFNMFYISPYCDPSLPVYSIVQQYVPYPWCLILYIAGFTAAAYIVLLGAMGIQKPATRKKSRV